MKEEKNNELRYKLEKYYEEKYVKYLEKRYGKSEHFSSAIIQVR